MGHMNFHVVVVHFPVALLTCYAALEMSGLFKMFRTEFWTKVKALCVVGGAFFSIVAFQTGEAIEHYFPGRLVETHAFFANNTIRLFTLLSLAYLLQIGYLLKKLPTWLQKTGAFMSNILKGQYLMAILGALGLFLLTVTGALGGALAHGPDIDPMVSIIYRTFVE